MNDKDTLLERDLSSVLMTLPMLLAHNLVMVVMKFSMNWDGFAHVLVIVIRFVVSSVSISVVELSFALRKEVEVRKIEPITNIQNCIYCKSFRIVKDGLGHNKHNDIKRSTVKNVVSISLLTIGFENMKHNPQGITTAISYTLAENL